MNDADFHPLELVIGFQALSKEVFFKILDDLLRSCAFLKAFRN
jgi:hypothetical protein